MTTQYIKSGPGPIAVFTRATESAHRAIPLILLHGGYFDHTQWNDLVWNITERKVVLVDMPFHGWSKGEIAAEWNLEDYVPAHPTLDTTLVQGAHVSPLESPLEVSEFIKRVISLSDRF